MKVLQFEGAHNITGSRIKAMRKARGLTQEQVAAQMQVAGIEINQKAISRIESGDRIVTDYELKQLAVIFEITSDSLLDII